MFNFLASTVSFAPDEKGDLIALDQPLLQMQSGGDIPQADYGMAFIKMFLTLIALAVLFGATVWFLRRLIRQRLEKGTGIQAIRILEKKMISQKTMLYVLEIDGERILISESQLEVRQLKIASPQEQDET